MNACPPRRLLRSPMGLTALPTLVSLLALLPASARAATLTVALDGSGQYARIQDAVNAAQSGDTVLVSDGTYTGVGNRDIDFGGRNITVRSAGGDPTKAVIDCGGSAAGVHRGFFFHSGETGAVVSGLTVRNGYENTPGGGSHDPTASGGAVAVATNSVATLTDCIFIGNFSLRGGGVYNDGTLTMTRCTLTGNIEEGIYNDGGGGLYSLGTVYATSCTFSGNSADGYGGGVTNSGPGTFNGCTITGNSATAQGGGMFNNGTLAMTDGIVYGDTGGELDHNAGTAAVNHCDIKGGYAGAGNLNVDPLFVGTSTGDLHLRSGSPCLGAGVSVGGLTTDRDGNPRPNPPSIGAYEPANLSHTWTAVSVSTGADGYSRVLWDNTNGTASVWKVNSSGQLVTQQQFGPYAGWTARAIATGGDNRTRLLWTSTNGTASYYLLDANNAFISQQQYGPYQGWTAQGLAAEPDGSLRAFWTNVNGTATIWTLDATDSLLGQTQYGPYPGWTAASLATSPDGSERLLWTSTSGAAAFWLLNSGSQFQGQHQYGPYTGYTARSIAAAPDGSGRVVWTATDGHIALWTIDAGNAYAAQSQYGPYAGWSPQALSVGADGNTRLLWDNAGGQSALWSLTPAGAFASDSLFGPY